MAVSINHQQQILSCLLVDNKMPHALVICSSNNDDKLAFSTWLSALLICSEPKQSNDILTACHECKSCQLLASSGHPDHMIVKDDERYISVDLIRNVTSFFEKTALISKRQVALILDSEKMTESAANALLKTLEEPTNNSFIVLTTSEVERLLPTIKSRCQIIELRSNSQAFECEASAGELSDNYYQFLDCFTSFLVEPHQRREITQLMIANTKSLSWCERLITNLMRNQANWLKLEEFTKLKQHKLERLQQLSHDDIWTIYQLICQNNKQLMTKTQINRQFQLEKLVAELSVYLLSITAKANKV